MATASTVAGVASGSGQRTSSMTHCLLQTNQKKALFLCGDVYLGGTDPIWELPASPWQFLVLCTSRMVSLLTGETHQLNSVYMWHNVTVSLPSALDPVSSRGPCAQAKAIVMDCHAKKKRPL